jgi:hypothetical protein
LLWSHNMMHVPSGARTRTKMMTSSSPLQCILIHLVSMLYEGDIIETVEACPLNPNRTWWLSWRRLVAWGRTWCVCVSGVLMSSSHAYCKYHNSYSHSTNNSNVFRRQIQSSISEGCLVFQDMQVENNTFSVHTLELKNQELLIWPD